MNLGVGGNWATVGADKGYDLDEIEKRITSKTKLIFLCNPNNPTGTLVPAKKLVDFCLPYLKIYRSHSSCVW